MQELINKLIDLKNRVSFEGVFDEFPMDACVLNNKERLKLLHIKNGYKRAIQLKKLISKNNNGDFLNHTLNFWIIQNWGRINLEKNDKNRKKIELFAQELRIKNLSHTFKTISSLSKIAAFVDIENYSIYDSRVTYAINWLILTTKPRQLKFFPMPKGRSSFITHVDMDTIINLRYPGTEKKELFYSDSEAYFEFCTLMSHLSKKVFNKNAKPFYLEMLLFAASKEEIFDEVKRKVRIKING